MNDLSLLLNLADVGNGSKNMLNNIKFGGQKGLFNKLVMALLQGNKGEFVGKKQSPGDIEQNLQGIDLSFASLFNLYSNKVPPTLDDKVEFINDLMPIVEEKNSDKNVDMPDINYQLLSFLMNNYNVQNMQNQSSNIDIDSKSDYAALNNLNSLNLLNHNEEYTKLINDLKGTGDNQNNIKDILLSMQSNNKELKNSQTTNVSVGNESNEKNGIMPNIHAQGANQFMDEASEDKPRPQFFNKSNDDLEMSHTADGISAENKVLYENPAKIIEVSDKSSEIKTNIMDQVKDKIIMMTKDGTKEITMELYPKELGKVNIKLSYEGNKLQLQISGTNEETNHILASNLKELTGILQNNTSSSVEASVKNHLTPYGFNDLNYDDSRQGQKENNRKKGYTFRNMAIDSDDESIITEFINLRNLKLNQIV